MKVRKSFFCAKKLENTFESFTFGERERERMKKRVSESNFKWKNSLRTYTSVCKKATEKEMTIPLGKEETDLRGKREREV